MNLIYSIDQNTKEKFDKLNLKDIDLYISSIYDLSLNYNPLHYVICNQCFYLINKHFEIIMTFKVDEIKEFTIENLLNYSRLYLKKENEQILIANIDKSQLKAFCVFQKYALKVLQKQMSEEDYQSKDILEVQRKKCKKCHQDIDEKLGYCPRCEKKSKTLFRILGYIKNYKKEFISIILLLIISSLIGVFTPILTNQILYNDVLESSGKWYGQILLFAVCYVTLELFSTLITIFYGRVVAKASTNLCYELKNDVFISIQRLSLNFFKDKKTGHLMNNVIWSVNRLFYLIIDVPVFCVDLMKILGIMTYLIILRVDLSLLTFIPIPIIIVLFFKVKPIFRKNWQQIISRNNELTSAVSDTLEGFRIVKVFSGHKKEVQRFSDISTRNSKAHQKQYTFHQLFYPLIIFIISFSTFITWGYGGYLVIKGEMSYGIFATFVAGLNILYSPIEGLINFIFSRIPSVLTVAREVFEIMDSKAYVVESNQAIDLKEIKGDIEFKDVSFSYEINQPILKQISFKVEANTSLGIVGQTGVGKSTLMSLLARLYDVNSGSVLIDGIDVKNISFKSLHQNISMISQDIYLFKGSIYENIKYAKPDATLKEVIEAAKIANAHDFIMKLENGYDSKIGEGELNLSGGERQRISIARAVLVNSKIIIFDEATSAMDTITEKAIQDSISKLSVGKTVLMIAHRLSTLKDVDRLIVIDKKTIVEEGSMEELIALKGKFYELYSIQQEALKHIRIGD